ncbi:MAG: hypothetical protein HYU51_04520 [Candidatus Rokubacteria bacterium]|nr:hypothetical protein [Candidatus Rokubacteria bacterium]
MKTFLSILALGSAVAFGVATVDAAQCPLLVKQLREATVADASKAAGVKKLTDECEQLHKAGKHADSVAKCDEAAKAGGITLTKKK